MVDVLAQVVARPGELVGGTSRARQGEIPRRTAQATLNRGFAAGTCAGTGLAGRRSILATLAACIAAVLSNHPGCRE